MSDEPLRWYIADRQQGKTTDLITWVKLGVKTTRYPYWSRIILEPNKQMADYLRGGDPATNRYGLEYHQVYYLQEWLDAYQGHDYDNVEVGIDNVDFFLRLLVWRGKITRATATGNASRWPELITPDEYHPEFEAGDYQEEKR